jgi:hypothetical protein
MSSPAPVFPLEYVTGTIHLPPFGAFATEVWINVLNVGETDEVTRAFGFRRFGDERSDQVFDSDVDFSPQLGPATGDVAARAVWFFPRQIFDDERNEYWFSIRATSPNLVPSIEFVRLDREEGSSLTQRQTFARYAPGDFAVFHRRVRLVPGVPAPEEGPLVE